MSELHVVTGAFGYSGKYITARLLEAGVRVRTLTNSLQRTNPFGDKVEARPFNFDQPVGAGRIAARRSRFVQYLLDSFQHPGAGLSACGGRGEYAEVI